MLEDNSSNSFIYELNNKVQSMPWPVIMPISFAKLLKEKKNIAIIDVREETDCCFEDRLLSSKDIYNVPFNSIVNKIGDLDLSSYDMLITICFAGPKGAVAASIMRWMGYDNVFFLKGGVEEYVQLENSY